MSIVVYFPTGDPMNYMDGGGCVWYLEVGPSGVLNVYQKADGSNDPQPIVFADHYYAPGAWRKAFRQ